MAEHRGHTSLQTKWESKSTAACSTEIKIKTEPPSISQQQSSFRNNEQLTSPDVFLWLFWRFCFIVLSRNNNIFPNPLPSLISKYVESVISSEGIVTNPQNWLVLFAVRIFLSLPTGTVTLSWVAEYILGFVVIFHKYISFFRQYFQNKDISHDLEIINVLSILPLSRLQNTLPLIYMSLRKNNVYCFMPRTSKPPDTCKWGGPKWKSILQLLPLFSLSRITLVAIKKLVSKWICGRKMSLMGWKAA